VDSVPKPIPNRANSKRLQKTKNSLIQQSNFLKEYYVSFSPHDKGAAGLIGAIGVAAAIGLHGDMSSDEDACAVGFGVTVGIECGCVVTRAGAALIVGVGVAVVVFAEVF
jgi:hypothetical protein